MYNNTYTYIIHSMYIVLCTLYVHSTMNNGTHIYIYIYMYTHTYIHTYILRYILYDTIRYAMPC